MIYQVYSDYSKTETQASYAYVVIKKHNKEETKSGQNKYKIHKSGSRKLKLTHNCPVGEAMGHLAGIRMVPDGSHAVVYIDIPDVVTMFKKGKRKQGFCLLKKELDKQRNRLESIEFIHLEKKIRPLIYHWCHKKARFRIECKNSSDPIKLEAVEDPAIINQLVKHRTRRARRSRKLKLNQASLNTSQSK